MKVPLNYDVEVFAIGKATAERIVSRRERVGSFRTFEDLKSVEKLTKEQQRSLPIWGTPVDRAKEQLGARAVDHGLVDARFGRILFDSQYPAFVSQLVPTAKTSVRLAMFLLRCEDRQDYPTDELIASMVAVAAGGVKVKVILNVDEESDERDASSINFGVGQYLTKNRVQVKYDRPEIALHSKLLVVDREHVVVGSHNWTAGSFFGYDDTSVYVASSELAAGCEARFDQFWAELPEPDSSITWRHHC